MNKDFSLGMKAALIIGVVLVLGILIVLWYFNGPIVARSENTDKAVWYEGFINGFLAVPTFFVSLFNHDYGIYRSNNSGGWYNFWFLVGIGAMFGGSSRASN